MNKYKQLIFAELPPPPAPPPTDNTLHLLADVLSCSRAESEKKEGSDSPTLQRRKVHSPPQRRGPAKWSSQGKYSFPFSSSSAPNRWPKGIF